MSKRTIARKQDVLDILKSERILDYTVNTIIEYADSDKNGVIDKSEFAKFFTNLAEKFGIEEVTEEKVSDSQIFLDKNSDQVLTKKEMYELARYILDSIIKNVEKLDDYINVP